MNATEQKELAELIAAASPPACVRCGRSLPDLSTMTTDQLDRMLHLMRKLMGRTHPAFAGSPPDEPESLP